MRIADYAQSLGGELYNFISYPIGGMARSKYHITKWVDSFEDCDISSRGGWDNKFLKFFCVRITK